MTDIPLPPGIPGVFEGPSFATMTAFAVSGGASIHVWTGLPHAPAHSVIVPSGSLAMTQCWHALSASLAVYRGAGPNLAPGDGDDPLVFVTGLPASPSLVDGGVTGIDADFEVVNATTAVLVRPGGFTILRHDAFPATVVGITVATLLATSPGFRSGRVDDDRYVALGCGGDQIPGTADDALVVVRGLAGPPGAIMADFYPLPPGVTPSGLAVSPSGVPIVFAPDAVPSVRLSIARFLPSGVSWSTEIVTPPATPSPFFASTIDVAPGIGDSVVVSASDDAGPGRGRVLLGGLQGATPTVYASWYDSENCGCTSTQVDEHDLALFSASGALSVSYSLVGSSQPFTFTVPQPWMAEPLLLKPNPVSLAVFSDDWTTAPPSALASIVTDLGPTRTVTRFAMPGAWAGGGTGAAGASESPRIVRLGPGRVAGFVAPPGGAVGPATLRIFSIPTSRVVGDGTSVGPSPFSLVVQRPVPAAALPLRIGMALPPALASPSVTVLFATGLTAPQAYSGILAPQAALLLDLSTTLAVLPMTVGGSQAALSVDVLALAPLLAGVDLYLQAVVQDGAALPSVTDAWQLVLF